MNDRDPRHCADLPLDAMVRAMKAYIAGARGLRRRDVREVNWRLVAELAREDAVVAGKQDAWRTDYPFR